MHFTPEEMGTFVKSYLAPELKKAGLDPNLLLYDQNKGDELIEWSTELYSDSVTRKLSAGMAVHWYNSTVNSFPESLQETHRQAPEKMIISTEACVDAEKPHWYEDEWYWSKEATDLGYDWAPENQKAEHPRYVPVYRYARDIIASLNNWVEGWVDWNMVLDREGGPNHASNWCVAPVIADTLTDSLYYTPLYYVMGHFSRFINSGAVKIGVSSNADNLMITAVQNPDGELVVVVLNQQEEHIPYSVELGTKSFTAVIAGKAIQTMVIN